MTNKIKFDNIQAVLNEERLITTKESRNEMKTEIRELKQIRNEDGTFAKKVNVDVKINVGLNFEGYRYVKIKFANSIRTYSGTCTADRFNKMLTNLTIVELGQIQQPFYVNSHNAISAINDYIKEGTEPHSWQKIADAICKKNMLVATWRKSVAFERTYVGKD